MTIDGTTQIYGIIGWPVSHSLSPAIQNRAFGELGLNKVYLPFPVQEVGTALAGLKEAGVRGLSVTIPHKQAVIPFLDTIDPVAEKIGAVNTLVIEDGRIHGTNTDWLGAIAAIREAVSLEGSRVVLLGSGGSARAIGFGLLESGAEVVLASRSAEKGEALAEELGCRWITPEDVETEEMDALVNATSAGMAPNLEQMAVSPACLRNSKVVMDIVYSPLETKLLREAARAGCRVINGLAMLLHQGAAQFEIWTGQPAPVKVMRRELLERLKD